MRYAKSTLALMIAALTLVASAALAGSGDLSLQAGSKLTLKGTSTMHDYQSVASKLDVTIQTDAAKWPAGRSGGEALEAFVRDRGVTGIQVVIPVLGLKSGKDALDKNMYKALKAEANPNIKFRMSGYDLAAVATETKVDAKGMLTVAGSEVAVPVTVTAVRDGEIVHLRGSVPLKMTQFGIKPPTMMMGALKVRDDVTVSFDLKIGPAGAGSMSSAQ